MARLLSRTTTTWTLHRCCIRARATLHSAYTDMNSADVQTPVPRAPFVATPPDVVERMLTLAKVGPRDVVYDLGSGDGRIPITAASRA